MDFNSIEELKKHGSGDLKEWVNFLSTVPKSLKLKEFILY